MRIRSSLLVSSLGLLLLAGPALAQAPKSAKRLPVLRGAIQDTLGAPLDGALIEIMGLSRRAFTPASGAYRFDDIKPGKYWVVARRIGYAPLQAALTFLMGDDREIVFQLEPLPQVLPELAVKGEDKAWQGRYRDFVGRSHGAFGYFLTRDDIDRSHPYYLSDAVRRYLPFVNSEAFFTPAFASFDRTLASEAGFSSAWPRYQGRQNCAPLISVNGGQPSGIWALNDFRPDMVEAVEVYRGDRMMPAEFAGWASRCGLVVVWMR